MRDHARLTQMLPTSGSLAGGPGTLGHAPQNRLRSVLDDARNAVSQQHIQPGYVAPTRATGTGTTSIGPTSVVLAPLSSSSQPASAATRAQPPQLHPLQQSEVTTSTSAGSAGAAQTLPLDTHAGKSSQGATDSTASLALTPRRPASATPLTSRQTPSLTQSSISTSSSSSNSQRQGHTASAGAGTQRPASAISASARGINSLDAFKLGQTRLTEEKLREMTGEQDLSRVKYFEIRITSDTQMLTDIARLLPNLEQLRVDDSRIHSFRDFGRGLRKLRVLSVCRCALRSFHGICEAFPQLEELYAVGNEISDISPLAFHPSLRVLQLQGNRISDLDQLDWLAECPNLSRLVLLGNPITSFKYYRRIVVTRVNQMGTLASLDGSPLEPEDKEPITDPEVEKIRETTTPQASKPVMVSKPTRLDDFTPPRNADPHSNSPTHSSSTSCTAGQTNCPTTIAADSEHQSAAITLISQGDEKDSTAATSVKIGVGALPQDVFGWDLGSSIFGGLNRPGTSSSSISGTSRGKADDDVEGGKESLMKGPQAELSTTLRRPMSALAARHPSEGQPGDTVSGLVDMKMLNEISGPVVGAVATVKRIRTKRQNSMALGASAESNNTTPAVQAESPSQPPKQTETSSNPGPSSIQTPASAHSMSTRGDSTPSNSLLSQALYSSSLALDDWSEMSAAVAHGIEPASFAPTSAQPRAPHTPASQGSDSRRAQPASVAVPNRRTAAVSPAEQTVTPRAQLVASPRVPLVAVPVPPKHIRKNSSRR